MHSLDDFELAGYIGVDAGLCWIGDPGYFVGPTRNDVPEFKDWRQFCRSLGDEYPTIKQFQYPAGHDGLGVCVSTGWGDGVYPIYIRKGEQGRIMEVRVLFDE